MSEHCIDTICRVYMGAEQGENTYDRPIDVNITKSSSASVGATVVERGRVGLYGRPFGAWWPFIDKPVSRGEPRRATKKAHPTPTQPTSPLRNPGLGFRLMPIGHSCGRPVRGHYSARFPVFTLVFLFALSISLFSVSASAHAIAITGTGHIYGQLLDGTKRNAPVAGQSVTLQMAQGDNARDLTNVTTDVHGMFSFSSLNTGKTINYALYTFYHGAQYYTDLIDLSTKPVQQINLTIYDATTSVANIAIVQANVLIDKIDAQHNLMTISENFFFENLGTTTYVGSLQANGNKPNALRFSLPNNARNLSLRSGFDGYQSIQVEPGFATDAALPPGTSQFAFSFQVPYTTSSYDFGYTIVYPTVNLSVLIPLNIHASSAAMDSQGPVTVNQRTFQQFNAKKLLPDSQIHLQLDGLPVSQSAPNPQPLNQNTLWIILAFILMLTIVSITWFIFRLSRHQARSRKKQTPQTSRRGGSGLDVGRGPLGRPASNVDARREPLNRSVSADSRPNSNDVHPLQKDQQEMLLQELLILDKAYEAGTIKKAEFEERRTRTKAQLRSLMSKDFVEKSATTKKTARSSGKGAT